MPDKNTQAFRNFLLHTGIIAVFLVSLHYILKLLVPEMPYSPARLWLIVFFFAITNFIYYYQLKATSAKGSKFVNIFLVTTGFKLLFFLSIIVIYALIVRDDAVRFITDFFILYLIFTIVEVFQIKKFQNRQTKR